MRQVRAAHPPLAVTFPATTPLLITRVQIALGADLTADPLTWPWEDITQFVRVDLGISLTVGRRDEATQVSTASGQLKLDNRDGRFTRRNPTSPYYGLLSKNTPIWATVDAGSGEKSRLELFVNEWPSRWDRSGNDATVTVACAGILRRLAQGSIVKTALRRTMAGSDPVGYWPFEDGPDAAFVASGLPDGIPMTFGVVAPTMGEPGIAIGGGFAADFANLGNATATLTSTTSSWSVSWVAALLKVDSDLVRLMDITAGTIRFQAILGLAAMSISVVGPSNSVSLDAGNVADNTAVEVEPHLFVITATQTGADVTVTLRLDGVQVDSDTITSATCVTPATIKACCDQIIGTAVLAAGTSLLQGHVALYYEVFTDDLSDALGANVGEMAHVRIARLCLEENVPYESGASTSQTMGPQAPDGLLNLLRDAEAVGGGVLYERRWGLAYQSLAERYNAPVGLTLDFAAGQVAAEPEPADDDQRTLNRFKAEREDGGEVTAQRNTGPMGTGRQGPGIYDNSETFNVELDTQLPGQAGWKIHLGTIDEDRWPVIAINLAHDPGLIETWTALGFGARLNVTSPLDQMVPDAIDQVIEGYKEFWDPFVWTADLNCSPASAYRVYTVGSTDGNLGRVDSTTSYLAADATSTATSLSVASPNALWAGGLVSFDIGVGGEQMTVSSIGLVMYDTFTRSASSGWGTPNIGGDWAVSTGTASDFSVNGSVGIMSHSTIANHSMIADMGSPNQDVTIYFRLPVAPTGGSAAVVTLVRPGWIDANTHYDLRATTDAAGVMAFVMRRRVTGTGAVLATGTSLALDITHWYGLRMSVDTGAGTGGTNLLKAKFWDATTTTQPDWELLYEDDFGGITPGNLIEVLSIPSNVTNTLPYDIWFDDIQCAKLRSPQTFRVTRSVNGVIKAQPATVGGYPTMVSLWKSGVYAL